MSCAKPNPELTKLWQRRYAPHIWPSKHYRVLLFLILALYGGLSQRQKHFLPSLSHTEVHRDAHEPHVILRIAPFDDPRPMITASQRVSGSNRTRAGPQPD